MRVGSSELFGSPWDAQSAAREPWQAEPSWGDEPTLQTSGDQLQTGRGRKVISGRAEGPSSGKDEAQGECPPRAMKWTNSGKVPPVREDPLRGNEAGIGFESTGI